MMERHADDLMRLSSYANGNVFRREYEERRYECFRVRCRCLGSLTFRYYAHHNDLLRFFDINLVHFLEMNEKEFAISVANYRMTFHLGQYFITLPVLVGSRFNINCVKMTPAEARAHLQSPGSLLHCIFCGGGSNSDEVLVPNTILRGADEPGAPCLGKAVYTMLTISPSLPHLRHNHYYRKGEEVSFEGEYAKPIHAFFSQSDTIMYSKVTTVHVAWLKAIETAISYYGVRFEKNNRSISYQSECNTISNHLHSGSIAHFISRRTALTSSIETRRSYDSRSVDLDRVARGFSSPHAQSRYVSLKRMNAIEKAQQTTMLIKLSSPIHKNISKRSLFQRDLGFAAIGSITEGETCGQRMGCSLAVRCGWSRHTEELLHYILNNLSKQYPCSSNEAGKWTLIGLGDKGLVVHYVASNFISSHKDILHRFHEIRLAIRKKAVEYEERALVDCAILDYDKRLMLLNVPDFGLETRILGTPILLTPISLYSLSQFTTQPIPLDIFSVVEHLIPAITSHHYPKATTGISSIRNGVMINSEEGRSLSNYSGAKRAPRQCQLKLAPWVEMRCAMAPHLGNAEDALAVKESFLKEYQIQQRIEAIWQFHAKALLPQDIDLEPLTSEHDSTFPDSPCAIVTTTRTDLAATALANCAFTSSMIGQKTYFFLHFKPNYPTAPRVYKLKTSRVIQGAGNKVLVGLVWIFTRHLEIGDKITTPGGQKNTICKILDPQTYPGIDVLYPAVAIQRLNLGELVAGDAYYMLTLEMIEPEVKAYLSSLLYLFYERSWVFLHPTVRLAFINSINLIRNQYQIEDAIKIMYGMVMRQNAECDASYCYPDHTLTQRDALFGQLIKGKSASAAVALPLANHMALLADGHSSSLSRLRKEARGTKRIKEDENQSMDVVPDGMAFTAFQVLMAENGMGYEAI